MPSRFSPSLLHRQPPGMSLGVFLAKEYPAYKSSGLTCLFSDDAPAGIGSCREVVIQSCDIELNGHPSDPAAPAPTFRAQSIRRSDHAKPIAPPPRFSAAAMGDHGQSRSRQKKTAAYATGR